MSQCIFWNGRPIAEVESCDFEIRLPDPLVSPFDAELTAEPGSLLDLELSALFLSKESAWFEFEWDIDRQRAAGHHVPAACVRRSFGAVYYLRRVERQVINSAPWQA